MDRLFIHDVGSPIRVISPTIHSLFHFNPPFYREDQGRSLVTFKLKNYLSEMGQRWSERYIHFILFFQQRHGSGGWSSGLSRRRPISIQVWSVCYFWWTRGAGISFYSGTSDTPCQYDYSIFPLLILLFLILYRNDKPTKSRNLTRSCVSF
jgi:hypothetical protein